MLNIYDKNNKLLLSTDINSGSKRVFSLMGDDYITLVLNVSDPFYLPIGAYCECDFGRFELTKESNAAPTIGVGYNYSVQLDNQYIKWNNKLFMWHRGQTDQSSNFSVAVNLVGAMDMVLADLKALGFQYRFKGVKKDYSYNVYSVKRTLADGYTIEGIDKANEVKNLQFDGMYLLDALYYIAKQWDTECWIEDSIINIGKCENTAKIDMEYSENGNISKITRSDSQSTHATRLWVYGGTTNVPARYRKELIFTTKDGTTIPYLDFSPSLFPESMREERPGTDDKDIAINGKTEEKNYTFGSSVEESIIIPFPTAIKAEKGNYRVDLSKLNITFNYTSIVVEFKKIDVSLELEYADNSVITVTPASITANKAVLPDKEYAFVEDVNINASRNVIIKFKGSDSYKNQFAGTPLSTFPLSISVSGTIDFYFSGEKVTTKVNILTAPGKPELDGTSMDCVFNPTYAPDGSEDARKMSVTLPAGTTFTIDGIIKKECPSYWFYSQTGANVNKENRLALDGPLVSGYADEETYIDAQVIHEDIYPRMKDHYITSVETDTAAGKDEDNKEIRYTTYKIKDEKLVGFNAAFILDGVQLEINFSGELHDDHVPLLAGLTIPVTYNKSDNSFQLLRTKVGDTYFPNETYFPQVGDGYTLTGYDADYMEGELTKEAEAELKEQGLKDLEDYKVDNSTYSVTLFTYDGNFYQAGTRVDLIAKGFFKDTDNNTRKSRIIGYELDMAQPYKAPVYTIGEAEVYSRLQSIENKIGSTNKGSVVGNGNGGKSVYVIGRGDSTQPTDTNVYAAARSDAQYIRKDQDDKAYGTVEWQAEQHFNNGAKFGNTIDSMVAGRGTLVTNDGRIQTDRIEVRHSMSVMELKINQIQGMAADFDFTDVANVSAVTKIGDSTYTLTLRKDLDTDVMLFRENDIIRQVVNTIPLGGKEYYTSWMRVVSIDSNAFALNVVLYPDTEVPGGKNYPPQPEYNIGRRGNVVIPSTEDETNERAGSWYLSSLEGRIAFLKDVYKPILEDNNYGLAIGNLPELESLSQYPDLMRKMGVYAHYMFAQDFYRIDYNGNIVPDLVNRGEWSKAVAESNKPYRYIQTRYKPSSGNQSYTLLEQHVVTHFGCTWGCLVDKTTDEPAWNSPAWVMLMGDPNYYITFSISPSQMVLINNVDATVTASVTYANQDITGSVMATPGTVIEWFRETKLDTSAITVPARKVYIEKLYTQEGLDAEDKAWLPTYPDDTKKNIITLANKDMGSGWGEAYRTVTFICRITIPVGSATVTTEEKMNINI